MKKKILLVDDQYINRNILNTILRADYQILEVSNGREAMETLYREPDVSAVLLDLVMPEMDGYQVLMEMKHDERLKEIPVIIATQKDRADAEAKVLMMGASDFVSKPYSAEVIRRRLQNLIELYEMKRSVTLLQRDRMTGILNREAFFLKCRELLENSTHSYVMIALDIQQFKLYNDLYGKKEADLLLRRTAEGLKEIAQTEKGLGARISADQFALLLPIRAGYFRMVEERLQRELQELLLTKRIYFQYGICEVKDPTAAPESLYDNARLALASIKGKYDQNHVYFEETMRKQLLWEQSLAFDLDQALENHELELFLQPQYDLQQKKIVGAEALIRWHHPQYGFLQPAQFIPMFEQNGLIARLDFYTWKEACRLLSSWKGTWLEQIPLSVNVSRNDFYEKNLISYFSHLMREYQLLPSKLHLEITESAYAQDHEELIRGAKVLKQQGFILEMDDFGSGYSSLNALAELPVDILKLDVRFIQQFLQEQKEQEQGILRFVLKLAEWRGLKVIAEGVETREQAEKLKQMNYQMIQGYYFAKPMPTEQFFQLDRKKKRQ